MANLTGPPNQSTAAVKKQASPHERRSLEIAISHSIRLSIQDEQPQDGAAVQSQLFLQQQWLLSHESNGWQHLLQPQLLSLEAQPQEGSEEAAQPHDGSAAAGAAHDGSAGAGAAAAGAAHDGSAGAAHDASSFAQPHDASSFAQQHLCLNKPRHALAWLSSATDTQTTTAKQTAARTNRLRFISILHEKNVWPEARCPSTHKTCSTPLTQGR